MLLPRRLNLSPHQRHLSNVTHFEKQKMRRSTRNKENIAPKARTEQPDNALTETFEPADEENNDTFVVVSHGSASSQIEKIETSTGISTKTINNEKGADRKDEEQNVDSDSDESDMNEDDMDGLGGLETSVDLDDFGLDELLEIEQKIPDDLGPLDLPDRPQTPLSEQSSRSQPLSEIDPKDLPAPLNVNKLCHSKDKPTETESQFEEIPDDPEKWFEEGEVDEDGIRREEVEMSFAEWNLEGHPRFEQPSANVFHSKFEDHTDRGEPRRGTSTRTAKVDIWWKGANIISLSQRGTLIMLEYLE
ncbi:hypothetical protein BKA64DRAFT_637921 [Cadophora sp. MPI-SDFR-AT-0126]|nr:hypothetical protein BKA64DRAFT_637921 [Leotiomycetes sp. MPI-SDFR-AT-0126]